MNVSLTPELENFVHAEVGSGLYQTASEVVRAGLRRLKLDQQDRIPALPRTREALEADLLQSIEALDDGNGIDGEEVLRKLRQRIQGTRKRG